MKKPSPLPKHLKKYVVAQNYSRYTPEDQAVWRYIMRQLKSYLKENAHPCYADGLKKTGLTTDSIPRISDMNSMLNKFSWGAVPVSGFIPPAAFMEFQSLGYLPIACEMRSVDHIHYTPAPDIVHEAAGHAPILIDKNFSNYLKAYAEVASHAIISDQDMDLYESIRLLSDAKEKPGTPQKQIAKLEENLEKKSKAIRYISEAGLLGRMNWWTAEYGLIGSLNKPKIYGAGLLSSISESRECLQPKVKKVPFSMDCLNYSYDITEPQPQLFVTPSFRVLTNILNDLGSTMAYSQGGELGLNKALKARTVNTVQLNSGLQISGIVNSYEEKDKKISFVKFSGPTQLSYKYTELKGHNSKYHSHGYSTPVGRLKGASKCLSQMTAIELKKAGIVKNKVCVLTYESGIIVTGRLTNILSKSGTNLVFSFKDCSVVYNNQILFHPDWGNFDLSCGESIPSVFGGPADRAAYGETADFVAKKLKPKKLSPKQAKLMEIYSEIRSIRKSKSKSTNRVYGLFKKYKASHSSHWLLGLELYELSLHKDLEQSYKDEIYNYLNLLSLKPESRIYLNDGIKIANKII